ncbi:hypothetical protein T484DRAFT_2025367 [Baffinella frigidus]|nr:hypothetical protein T484DRAFT_2025367 [Cryptophyta sp. CCMP2293]
MEALNQATMEFQQEKDSSFAASASQQKGPGKRMSCCGSAPERPEWEKIVPERRSALQKHVNELGALGEPAPRAEDEQRKWVMKKYAEHFFLVGGGCKRRSGGNAGDSDYSFHVRFIKDGTTCCDGATNLRNWMLLCLWKPPSQ